MIMLQEPRAAPPGWVLTIYYSVHRPDGSPECHVCISVQQRSDVECNEVQKNSLWALLMKIQRVTWCFATFAFAANFMWNVKCRRVWTTDHQVYCGWQPNHLAKKKVCRHAIGDNAVVKCISLQNQTNCSNIAVGRSFLIWRSWLSQIYCRSRHNSSSISFSACKNAQLQSP